MKRKDGNAKALHGFFPQGGSMKWFVAVFVLLMGPASALASNDGGLVTIAKHTEGLIGQVQREGPFPYISMYTIRPFETLDNIQIKIRLFADSTIKPESFAKNKCQLFIRSSSKNQTQIFPIEGPDRLELWVSHLPEGGNGLVMVTIAWSEKPLLDHTTIEVTSEQAQDDGEWKAFRPRIKRNPFKTTKIREVPFADVCQDIEVIGVEPKES